MTTKPRGGDLDLDFHSLGVSACLLAAPLKGGKGLSGRTTKKRTFFAASLSYSLKKGIFLQLYTFQ